MGLSRKMFLAVLQEALGPYVVEIVRPDLDDPASEQRGGQPPVRLVVGDRDEAAVMPRRVLRISEAGLDPRLRAASAELGREYDVWRGWVLDEVERLAAAREGLGVETRELGRLLDFGDDYLAHIRERGMLRGAKIGQRWYYNRADVERFFAVNERRVGSVQRTAEGKLMKGRERGPLGRAFLRQRARARTEGELERLRVRLGGAVEG